MADGRRQTANGKKIHRVFDYVVGLVFCFKASKDFPFGVSHLAFHWF